LHPGSIPGEASKNPLMQIGTLIDMKVGSMGLDFQVQRIKMVDGQLRTTDVTGRALLAAFLEIPRENFVPQSKKDLAYLDADIEIAPGRFLPEPSPFAKLTSLADIVSTDHVLEIGCGTGYTTAILARIAAHVTAVESNETLADTARANLSALSINNAEIVSGDLASADKASGSFDVIVISGSVSAVPASLFKKLNDGGRLVCVENHGSVGLARLYSKRGNDVSGRFGFNASMPLLPGFEKPPAFAF
jgi:protein-L-isoaspartate(D-aspartate) O-methyltransferase